MNFFNFFPNFEKTKNETLQILDPFMYSDSILRSRIFQIIFIQFRRYSLKFFFEIQAFKIIRKFWKNWKDSEKNGFIKNKKKIPAYLLNNYFLQFLRWFLFSFTVRT